MAEIWSLEALCRCCHADGEFKHLQEQYFIDNTFENYLHMLRDTLGISIKSPPVNASFSICDDCIMQLRRACKFKRQVLACEAKFEEYCKNELSQETTEAIKTEPEYLDDDIFDSDENKDEIITSNPVNTVEVPTSWKKIKKEDSKEVIEIAIEIESKIENKPAKRRNKPKDHKVKPKQIKPKLMKPKEEESLVVKVKTETGELFSCKNCGVSYEDLDELNNHINVEHYKGYKCVYCDETFPNERRFKIHNQKVHGDSKPFLCPHCDKKVGSKISLADHVNSVHTKERFYQCDECQKVFHNKHVLRVHLYKHYGTFRKLICEQCGVGCNDKTNLRYHVMTVHEKVKMFGCNVCGKRFSARKHLKVHIRSHTGERPYECDICSSSFMAKEGLIAHKRLHENMGYKCKRCDEVFPTRGQYASHYRNHVGHKTFKCHLCSKEFAGKYSLNRHVFEHSGERPFACNICNKNFKQKPQLVRHNLRIHNPNKPEVVKEKCDICKRTVPNLVKHIEAHSNKPYACHLCEKRYPEQNALNRHLQRHTGEKPHKCDLCDRGFVQMKSLKNHKMKVHKLPLKTEQEDHYDSLVNTYTIQNLKRK